MYKELRWAALNAIADISLQKIICVARAVCLLLRAPLQPWSLEGTLDDALEYPIMAEGWRNLFQRLVYYGRVRVRPRLDEKPYADPVLSA